MNRREFLGFTTTAALATICSRSGLSQISESQHGFPASELESYPSIETEPIAEYRPAPPSAYEAFQDMKFGARVHWGTGLRSFWHKATNLALQAGRS